MEGIKEIAKSYYERASEEEMGSLLQSFNKLDVNSDGKISLQEFKNSVSSRLSAEAVFKKLDENGDGSLDFDEFLCLEYMEKKVDIGKCNGCWDLLVGPYFSCWLCLIESPHRFDLCCGCYSRLDVLQLPQHHPSDYVIDHHSLIATLGGKAATAHKTEDKREMEEIRKIAKAYYGAGSREVQESAYHFFQSMDTDGDGRVDRAEFLEFLKKEGYWNMQNDYFFDELDHDGNGNLDFSEVKTLYYIIRSGRPFCRCCDKFIPGIFFSCVDCFKNPRTSFDLCRDCFCSKKCDHKHDGRSLFLDNYTLLHATRDPALAQASGVEASNAIVPAQSDMYVHNEYNINNTYVVHPPTAAIVHSQSKLVCFSYGL